jgi:hypothetical protein
MDIGEQLPFAKPEKSQGFYTNHRLTFPGVARELIATKCDANQYVCGRYASPV